MKTCSLEFGALKKAEQDAIDARRVKLDALRDAAKRDGVMRQIESNGGIKNALETLHSILRGSNKLGDGGRDSIENGWHSYRDGWMAAINNELYKVGLKKASESGALDKDIAKSWWKISNGEDAGNSQAAQIAKLNSKALDSVRDKLNAAGGRIGDARDYVTTTEWDSVRMRQAAGDGKTPDEAFDSWWAKDRPRMSEKTFSSIHPMPGQSLEDAQKAFGRDLFDAFLTGVHMKVGAPESGYIHPDFSGTSNVANKVSVHRAIKWKDAESWYGHMQDFGTSPTLHASVINSLDRGARSLALMEKLGNNPAANLNMIIKRVQETYRDDVDGIKKFQGKTRSLTNEMRDLDGTLNIPANMGLEKFTSGVQQIEAVSSLGGVGITHLVSTPVTVSSELAHHGINRLESLGGLLKAFATGMGDADRRNILADLGAYADGALRHVQGKIGDDSVPGHISAIAGRFMDATGIHVVFDRTKAGVRDMLAHNLGRNIERAWEELDPHLTQMLGQYRIGKEEWELMRGMRDLPTWNGRKYLTPSAAADGIDRANIENILRSKGISGDEVRGMDSHINDYKQGISDKLLSYYSDAAKHGVVSSGVRERALLHQGTQKGTGANTMLRFLTQFKMWPVAAANQILEREIYMSLSNKEAAFNIGKLVAIGVPAGYLRMAINDLATGRPPRDPKKPETLLAAAAQSGGLGIFGDFLFGETSRMGGGLISTLGGPVVSDADQLIKIFGRAKGDIEGEGAHHKNGKFGDVWPDLAHFGVRHVPFANLVYLKGALDYMVWYHLYEAASPGWWERTNRRLQKDQGRTMQGYTPGGGVPYGVPAAHLSNGSGGSTGIFGNDLGKTNMGSGFITP